MNKEILDVIQPAKKELAKFKPGDTVRVTVKIIEGGTERLQPFEGVVIRKKGGGVNETFTVRRVSFGVGIERIFPVNSPGITKFEVVKQGSVRRAKLYYLRGLSGRAAKIKEIEVKTQKEPAATA